MKNLLNLKNAKILSKREQKSINGGILYIGNDCTDECTTDSDCTDGTCETFDTSISCPEQGTQKICMPNN